MLDKSIPTPKFVDGKTDERVGSDQERATCGQIMDEVMVLWNKGHHDLDSRTYNNSHTKWDQNKCHELEGFPPFGKIPKS